MRTHATAVGAVAVLAASVLTACGNQTPGGTQTGSGVGQSTSYTVDAGAQPAPEDDPNAPLVMAQCGQGLGPWGFQGRIRNSGEEEREFTVKIEITRADGGDVVAEQEITETVPAGETVPVESLDIYSGDEPEGELTCVVNLVTED